MEWAANMVNCEVSYTMNRFVHLSVHPSSHIRHNSYMFWHYCAIIRKIQCFQVILNTSKTVRCNLIYAAFHATCTGESSCSSHILVFGV